MHQKYTALILCTPILGATPKYQQAFEKSVPFLRETHKVAIMGQQTKYIMNRPVVHLFSFQEYLNVF